MGYTVSLKNEDGSLAKSEIIGGSNIAIDSHDCIMTVTFNYREWFILLNPEGIYFFEGKKGIDTILELAKGLMILGIDRNDDYWESTPGNAGYILLIMQIWALANPEARWEIR